MSKVIVFAGTTEGRTLSEWLSEKRISHTVCVATEYGEQVLKESPFAKICRGRMNEVQMKAFFEKEEAEIIVDATHPYAYLVTENIRQAAKQMDLPYLRLLRDGMKGEIIDENSAEALEQDMEENIRVFPTTEACAEYLMETTGPIFLTTGSKELHIFCEREELKSRLIARVLPGNESIAICEALGLPGKQIVAMQGPFSTDMNKALLKNYGANVLVTKASGKTGGFAEKLQAAGELGVKVCVIGRPKVEDGFFFAKICEKLEEILGVDSGFGVEYEVDPEFTIRMEEEFGKETFVSAKRSFKISLIGCGMGHPECLTIEASRALEEAELVFGASRLLRDMKITKESYPWYLARDILPFLEQREKEKALDGDGLKVAILYSGDTGFYSGAKKMHLALKEAVAEGRISADLKIYPGISSIVNLAAELGESWEDAKILSIHGMGTPDKWSQKFIDTVKTHAKTFLLLSGAKDLQTIGELLKEWDGIRIFVGYQMSYPEQEILELTAEECIERGSRGTGALYSLFILNEKADACESLITPMTHGLPDDSFIRGKVPMTKEEVRTISISKLKLTDHAVVYDVGSGTGSVAVEIARLSPSIQVYAIERKPEAVELIRQNKEKFGLHNIEIVSGLAPEALEGLPAPTHVFIGGTGGQMDAILHRILEKENSQQVHFVVNAVSFETLQELLKIEEKFAVQNFDMIQLSATRTRKLGNYHMTQGENPVWICSFVGNYRINGLR